MNSEEIKQSITGWCSPDNGLELTGDRSDASSDFVLGVRSAGVAGAPVEIEVVQVQGADRVAIRHTASASGRSKDAAQTLLDQRPGWITGTVDTADTGTSVKLETVVYHDGFSKNAFMQAVAEVSRSARLLGGLSTAAASTETAGSSAAAAGSYAASGAAGTAAGGSPVPAPSFSPQTQPQYQPQAQPQYQAQPAYQPQSQPQYQPQAQPQYQPQGGGWAPTHSVPPQGLRAWAAPDPSGPVVANLAPGLPIQVSEVRGAWARVICSNGWTGWIDGRIIGVAA